MRCADPVGVHSIVVEVYVCVAVASGPGAAAAGQPPSSRPPAGCLRPTADAPSSSTPLTICVALLFLAAENRFSFSPRHHTPLSTTDGTTEELYSGQSRARRRVYQHEQSETANERSRCLPGRRREAKHDTIPLLGAATNRFVLARVGFGPTVHKQLEVPRSVRVWTSNC